jgi:hypothetical protein
MTISYPGNILPTTCGQMIKLERIEVMSFCRAESDAIVDILQADWVFSIRSMTGIDYTVSALSVKEWIKEPDIKIDELVQAIFDKWARL